ncbi:MAG TPA: hypothetical protein ENJ82_01710 [Bacteroidetes bacterium]|nr:hypothetical protein [Bacteroidota bacterium]
MDYVLYVSEGCESCTRVVRYLEKNQVPISVINLTEKNVKRPPAVVIVPALFKKDRLLAYGPDIQRMIEKQSEQLPDMSQD